MTTPSEIDQRLDRITVLLASIAEQIGRLSEQITRSENLFEARTASLDAKLDRIADTLSQQSRSLEGHIRLAEQQSQTTAQLTNLVSQLLTTRV